MEAQYLNEQQVSDLTGISVSTLRMHRHKCKGIPYIKYGRRVLYKIDDINNFLQSCKIQN